MSRPELGWYGEQIVKHVLESKGHVVETAKDLYDSEKDLKVNGKSAEVKTIQLYRKQNLCSIRQHQIEKCTNVDYLFFVLTPDDYGRNFIEVVGYPKCCRYWIEYKTSHRHMFGLKLSNSYSVEKIYDDKLVDKMRRLTYTQY